MPYKPTKQVVQQSLFQELIPVLHCYRTRLICNEKKTTSKQTKYYITQTTRDYITIIIIHVQHNAYREWYTNALYQSITLLNYI